MSASQSADRLGQLLSGPPSLQVLDPSLQEGAADSAPGLAVQAPTDVSAVLEGQRSEGVASAGRGEPQVRGERLPCARGAGGGGGTARRDCDRHC